MSYKHEQARELNGIGSSNWSGTKRAAEHGGTSSIYDAPDRPVWKNERPTPITTACMVAKPRNVSNPYNRVKPSADSISRPSGSNPTAQRTITEHRGQESNKRPRMEGLNGLGVKFPEKYGSNGERQRNLLPRNSTRRGIPSFISQLSTPATPSVGHIMSKYYTRTPLKEASTPVLSRTTVLASSVINLDESDQEDVGTVISRPKLITKSDSRDEIDIIDVSLDQPSHQDVLRTSDRLDKPSILEREEFLEGSSRDSSWQRRKSSPLLDSTKRQTQAWNLAEDGASTKRLSNRLRSHTKWDVPTESDRLASSPYCRRPLPRKETKDDDEVEEIEDADDFDKTVKPSSSKNPAAEKLPRRDPDRGHLSGVEVIRNGHVNEVVNHIAKHHPVFYPDLKQAGNSKVDRMKGKAQSASTSSRTKGVTSQIGVNLRDKDATASTPYIRNFALPLELYIWGSQKKQLDESEPQPDYWLYWNEDVSQLQVHEQPVPQPETVKKRKPIQSISLSSLGNAGIQVSDDRALHVLRINFTGNRGLPDDLRTEGLTFKILSRHGNITEWDGLVTRIKNLLSRNGRKLEILKGFSARGCLQSALQSATIAESRPQRRLKESIKVVDVSTDAPAESARTKDPTTHEKKKKRPQPRPVVNGKGKDNGKNKDTSEILAYFPRRSTRLSTGTTRDSAFENTKEVTKDRKEEREEPPSNLDEIILVYPPSGQGAVNITTGDLRRLEPAEFLNDTIIEFGLKLWLNDLRQERPELADSVHVFSPFFFKKLVSKGNKTPEEGHKSVRKWTAKVDIFKKKYIIVPINENIHWYLALIYHPEHILAPAPPKPRPRYSKRLSDAAPTNEHVSSRETAGTSAKGILVLAGDKDGDDVVASIPDTKDNESEAEAEVEGLVDETKLLRDGISLQSGDGFTVPSLAERSPGDVTLMNIDKSDNGDVTMDIVEDSLSEDESDDEQIDQLDEDDAPFTVPRDEQGSITPLPPSHNTPISSEDASGDRASSMDVDAGSSDGSLQYLNPEEATEHPAEDVDLAMHDIDTSLDSIMEEQPEEKHEPVHAVPATNFYGRTTGNLRTYEFRKRPSTNGALPVRNNQQDEADELDMLGHREQERQISEEPAVTEHLSTIIFTMDSLGNQHPKALTKLNQYLQEEAKDKKGVANPSNALTKKALVPTQPNYCDCGLYLLHFAQTFVSDPEKYKAAIFSTKKTLQSDRNALWLNEQVGTMRERMKERILSESAEWKKQKAAKGQKEIGNKGSSIVNPANEPVQVEESDDEIEVSEVRHVGSSPKKQIRAARLR